MKESKFLKWLLIIQSFTPLILLLIIKYFDNSLWGLVIKFFTLVRSENWIDTFARVWNHQQFLQCILLVSSSFFFIFGIGIYLWFCKIQKFGFVDDAERISITGDTTELSATFFVSYVIPMLLDNITEIKGFLCFLIMMTMLIVLMRNTNLYYQNPVLAMLGYKTFQFEFSCTMNESLQGKNYIGITKGKFDTEKTIKRRLIADNVFLIYNKN